MSFFLDEPPPLDYEIPPPLDDKVRDDNDFDLDDEIIIEDNISTSSELPELELPSDYKIFSSASIEDSYLHNPEPPELPSPLKNSQNSSPLPPTECDEKETNSHCDVAEKKESEKVDDDSVSCCAVVANKSVIEETENTQSVTETIKHEDHADAIGERPEPEGSCESNDFSLTCDENRLKCKEEKQIDNANNIGDKPSTLNNIEELKTEDLKNDDDDSFDNFTEFQDNNQNENIPEIISENIHVPQLTIHDFSNDNDDDFDDFDEFESAIPVDRRVELVHQNDCELYVNEAVFEADFSGFNAFSDSKEEFDDFQDFTSDKTFQEATSQLDLVNSKKRKEDDDDDDFGDFGDFEEALPSLSTAANSSTHSKILMKPTNLNETIDMMFPPERKSISDEDSVEQRILKSDNFVSKLKDFDSNVALGYQYTSSKASQILIKSLGIDTRNILVSAQWSSSSNVPRFAANLSFNPIEPMKPSEGGAKSLDINPSVQPLKRETVPQADFDWSSSGLVNPLDAHKSNYLLDLEQLRVAMANSDKINSSSSLNHAQTSNDPTSLTNQTTDIDELLRQFDSLNTCPTSNYTHTSANSAPSKEPPVLREESNQSTSPANENEPAYSVVDKEVKQTVETETKDHSSIKSDISSDPFYQWSNNSNTARTIKLPETHIFTPEKGTSPVSVEVVSRDVSPPPPAPQLPQPNPLEDSMPIKAPVFVKEYHDIEYSLEPKRRTADFDSEFDEFQSAEPVQSTIPITDPTTLMPISVLEPVKAEVLKEIPEIKWPDPGMTTNQIVDEDFSFMDLGQTSTQLAQSNQVVSSLMDSNTTPAAAIQNLPLNSVSSVFTTQIQENFAEKISNESAAQNDENHDDDEFDDFQAAPAVVEEVKKSHNNPITLSPAHLVSQTATQPSTWISSFDDAEVSRFVAAFPKCKVVKAGQKSAVDDSDDWSDFVTATPQNPSKTTNNDDGDDWSMFVSMPPMTKIPSPGKNPNSSQSKPNFTSWNQPMKNQYVTHSTSFLTNPPHQFSNNSLPAYINNDNVPTHSMTITDNFNYHVQTFNNQQQQQQPKRANGVSTILPDLEFAMPKHNMMNNLSRGGHFDSGKK